MRIETKRVYEKAARSDGRRILIDRLWPRGLSKSDARIHHWARYVAPHFQNQLQVRQDSADWVAGNQQTIFAQRPDAQAKAFDDAGVEMPADLAEMQKIARGRGRV